MSIKKTEKIWHNGKLIPWEDAQIHVLSHVVSYGSSVFEGIRCYDTKQGPAVFRLRDHMQPPGEFRPHLSHGMPVFAGRAVRRGRGGGPRKHMSSCYIRPIVLRGYGDIGVNPLQYPIEVYIACWEWGAYLGTEALEQGVDVCVSSWARMAPNTLPAMAKAGANYMNSQLIRMEAIANGYSEGIALDTNGYVSEGSGENIFLVQDGVVSTPPLASACFPASRAIPFLLSAKTWPSRSASR